LSALPAWQQRGGQLAGAVHRGHNALLLI